MTDPRDEARDLFGNRVQRPMTQAEIPGLVFEGPDADRSTGASAVPLDPNTVDLFEED